MTYGFPEITLNINSLLDFNDNLLAEKVMQTINSYGNDFRPDVFDALQPLNNKYTGDIGEVIKVWMNEEGNQINSEQGYLMGSLLMKKKHKSKLSIQVNWEKSQEKRFNYVSIGADLSFIENLQKYNDFIKLCNDLIVILKPVQAQISNMTQPYSCEPINLKIRYPELQWLNIFGKAYINLFGRERLLKTPCYKIHEISEELIGIQLTENVFETISDNIRNEVKSHLGEDAFVSGSKSIHSYKYGKVPDFDFSEILFDESKPIEEPQIITRRKKE